MDFKLKLSAVNEIKEEDLEALRESVINKTVKLSTTKKVADYDRKDQAKIRGLKNTKIVLETKKNGILILIGNLQCDYTPPFGGSFFLKKIIQEETDFKSVKGVKAELSFVTVDNPTSNDIMGNYLEELCFNKDFEFNIGQFDEFMEIFEFYKKLNNEINNNYSFKVNYKSNSYLFLPSEIKSVDIEFKKEMKDQNGVLKGYIIRYDDYEYLKEDIKREVRELIDIHIEGGSEELAAIRRIGADNIYLSNIKYVNENTVKYLKQFTLINTRFDKKDLILSGEFKKGVDYEEDYEFLNLYDMGQKIKIDSIDNSLKLINQGATGSAAELLQYLIGDAPMPNKKSRKKILDYNSYIEGLNDSQKEAFMMAVDGNPVSLIKGPPGTGKTHVINAIVQYITKELGEKVIVSSQTHIAIDNVLDKLVENYDLIIPNRITNRRNKYSGEYIDETLYRTWGVKFPKHNERASNIKLKQAMMKAVEGFQGEKRFKFSEEIDQGGYSVIGATTTTSAIAGKKGLEILKGYNWLIIDEVSKCPITEVLRYLPYVDKIIMVGDDFQLAPLLEFTKDDVKNLPSYNEEMFEKLQTIYEQSVFAKVLEKAEKANRLVLLNENYRSVKQVLATYNVFYDGQLIGKREEIRPNKVHFQNDNGLYDNSDAIFVEVKGGQEVRDGTSRFNVEEINATVRVLEELIDFTINPEKVTVSAIFPYAAQINHFQKKNIDLINKAKKVFRSFEIDTVDAFQGKETDVVLVNTVVTDQTLKNFLNDFRRINVSMSRARDKLIVFGNPYTLSKISMKITGGMERNYFKDIINYIKANGKIIIYEKGGFSDGNQSKNKFDIA